MEEKQTEAVLNKLDQLMGNFDNAEVIAQIKSLRAELANQTPMMKQESDPKQAAEPVPINPVDPEELKSK